MITTRPVDAAVTLPLLPCVQNVQQRKVIVPDEDAEEKQRGSSFLTSRHASSGPARVAPRQRHVSAVVASTLTPPSWGAHGLLCDSQVSGVLQVSGGPHQRCAAPGDASGSCVVSIESYSTSSSLSGAKLKTRAVARRAHGGLSRDTRDWEGVVWQG